MNKLREYKTNQGISFSSESLESQEGQTHEEPLLK